MQKITITIDIELTDGDIDSKYITEELFGTFAESFVSSGVCTLNVDDISSATVTKLSCVPSEVPNERLVVFDSKTASSWWFLWEKNDES